MTTTTATRTNRYAGRCAGCSQTVPAEAGTIERSDAGWTVRHNPGACPEVTITTPATSPARIAVEDAGVYVMPDGTAVRVKANRAGTRTYASKWVEIGGVRVTDAGTFVNGDYEYVPGLVATVAAEGRKMTFDEASAFVVRYGRCIRCARHLKDGHSVERGMGPVCVRYFQAA